jgi:hypothetical protein
MSRRTNRSPQKRSFVLCGLLVISVVSSWILFVGGTRRNELLVGSFVWLFAGAFVYQVWRIETLHAEFWMSDVLQGWRIPWYVARDICVLIFILSKDLFASVSADSLCRIGELKPVTPRDRNTARQILITLYTTMSPNSIVIGIDPQRDRILFHQLQRSGVSKMDMALGVKSGGQEL